jgi:putative ABC transport system permease protein
MTVTLRPILSTLRRHKTAAALIVLQIALTCAIVSNAVFLIEQRLTRMNAPSGLAESELLRIRIDSIQRDEQADAHTLQDLTTLRRLPGVRSATMISQVPFGSNSSDTGIQLKPDQASDSLRVSFYLVDESALDTLGLHLVEGRGFTADDILLQSALEHDPDAKIPVALLDQASATALFPGRSAVGQLIYVLGSVPTRVVGVVERLIPPQPQRYVVDHSLLMPVRTTYRSGSYLLRVDPAQQAAVLPQAVDALRALSTQRIVREQRPYVELRQAFFRQDRWMAALLVAVCVALLVVTALGIVGLASFWVQQRTRMIGVRRALGATRAQIVGYFQVENLLLSGIGIVLGGAAAVGINQLLMQHYELPRLPWLYLPVGAAVLVALGQLAVLGPARRAAALPPAAVMRGA